MHELTESTGLGRKSLIATFPTLEAAIEHAQALSPVCLEIDEEYPTCADGLLADGRLIAIQPAGFRIAA